MSSFGLLKRMSAYKKKEVESFKSPLYLKNIRQAVSKLPPGPSFSNAIRSSSLSVIAEIKKASPVMGILRKEFDVSSLANAYQQGGASALSVLTDKNFFQGAPENIRLASLATGLPVLWKDFVVDKSQILMARAFGASAVLLITAILSDKELNAFSHLAGSLGLDVLHEVFNKEELKRVLAINPGIIGVNNRNLDTFRVNFENVFNLKKEIPDSILVVAESGIKNKSQINRLRGAGVSAALIGSSLLISESPKNALKRLLS